MLDSCGPASRWSLVGHISAGLHASVWRLTNQDACRFRTEAGRKTRKRSEGVNFDRLWGFRFSWRKFARSTSGEQEAEEEMPITHTPSSRNPQTITSLLHLGKKNHRSTTTGSRRDGVLGHYLD